ncbi:MAG: hypothetical protein QXX84_06560 [Sulfolobales archaeon]|jgi:hypothetical protein
MVSILILNSNGINDLSYLENDLLIIGTDLIRLDLIIIHDPAGIEIPIGGVEIPEHKRA